MATKWKNFTRNCWVKAAAWIVILAMAGVAAWQTIVFALYLAENPSAVGILDGRMLYTKNVPAGYVLDKILSNVVYDLINQADYGDENYITSGKGISEEDTYYNIYNEFMKSTDSAVEPSEPLNLYPAEEGAENYLSDQQIEKILTFVQINEIFDSGSYSIERFRQWLQKNRGVYAAMREQAIAAQLEQFHQISLRNYSDYGFYIYRHGTNTTLSNISEKDFTAAKQKIFPSRNGYVVTCELGYNDISLKSTVYADDVLRQYDRIFGYVDLAVDDHLLIGLKKETFDSMNSLWETVSNKFQHCVLMIGIAVLVSLFFLIILIFGAGRKPRDCEKYLTVFDRIWTELQLILFSIVAVPWGLATVFLLGNGLSEMDTITTADIIYTFAISISVAVTAVFLLVFLSQVRLIKSRKWLKNWILWRAFVFVFRWVRDKWLWICRQFRKTRLRRKLIILAVVLPLACAVWIPIPFIIAGLLYYGMRAVDRFEEVTSGAQNIRAGQNTHISVNGGGTEINTLADNLNYISEGLEQAVSTAVKSERLKSELISNVSHDIKTPLTSIITYIDLLKKCDLQDETAKEYLSVLDQKAHRLQTLTADLFDASKATSGAMNVDFAKTDFDALLRQALGERSAHLEKAGLDIRIQSQPPVYIRADGKLLWRILDNLISNCARYALPNSRVYISIQSDAQTAALTMKNISAVELNMPADELMQRFTRGDRSRHTEGSGLGLSIAQSLAELMNGSCRVEIDGDLFKAVVTIPLWD